MLRILAAAVALFGLVTACAADELKLATFKADITPPVGAPLCFALVPAASSIDDPLSARGVVITGAGQPIVLCALDWVGVGNSGHDVFRQALAKAAGTTPERVTVHCLHQHDAPGADFDAEALLAAAGLGGQLFDVAFAHKAIESVATAVREAAGKAQPVTHFSAGRAKVEGVASSRRVLGPDGKVKYIRWSATKDPEARAQPDGVIDPDVQLLAFWNGEKCLAVITYYATHPQSYYGAGQVSADIPGLARSLREAALPGVPHIHFDGAGGNVTAGKYNDGAHENRRILAERLAAGMEAAWKSAQKSPLAAADVGWQVVPVALPPAQYLDEAKLRASIANPAEAPRDRLENGRRLAWLLRCQSGHQIELSCLRLGSARVLHMPGELFVEYQLLAERLRPGEPVMMAAYGDYGPAYIGTEISYTQGGYETGPVSLVAPAVEPVLNRAIEELVR